MPYNRVHFDGNLGTSSERWSCSVAFASLGFLGEPDPDELGGTANAIMAQFEPGTGWPGTLRSMLGQNSTLNKVRVYYHPGPGQDATGAGESTAASVAGSGTIINDFTAALCVSLSTGQPGRSRRGRFYWPFLTAATENGGRISQVSVTSAARAAAFAGMLEAVGAQFTSLPEAVPIVVSEALSELTIVRAVRVGDVLDTQRRRRDKLAETYGSATL